MSTISLNGESLTPEILYKLGYTDCMLEIAPEAIANVNSCYEYLSNIVASGQKAYGINTGFGYFADVAIDADQLSQLQTNLIRSHSVGVGPSFTIPRTRMILCLRINVLCKGYSGVSPDLIHKLCEAYNKGCYSYVPEQGTVGACGDLAPLAHLFLGLMGEGKMWDQDSNSYIPALEVLQKKNYEPVRVLRPKEGLSIINGPQIITTLVAEALVRGKILAEAADIITALTVESLRSLTGPFNPLIHSVRPHKGQIAVAKRILALLQSKTGERSENYVNHPSKRVQDAYSLRCTPQVHGVVWDTMDFVYSIVNTELNSVSDNPLVFPNDNLVLSGGNFHGEYTAKMADFLAIAVHELGSISETRISRLMNKEITGFETFLIKNPGLNSGLMMVHCTAASLVSENKQLCSPASVDTIPTSAGQEDHVSMGGWAARKLIKVVENVENILAVELLSNLYAMEFIRPARTTEPLEKVLKLAHEVAQVHEHDASYSVDICALSELIRSGKLSETVEEYLY